MSDIQKQQKAGASETADIKADASGTTDVRTGASETTEMQADTSGTAETEASSSKIVEIAVETSKVAETIPGTSRPAKTVASTSKIAEAAAGTSKVAKTITRTSRPAETKASTSKVDATGAGTSTVAKTITATSRPADTEASKSGTAEPVAETSAPAGTEAGPSGTEGEKKKVTTFDPAKVKETPVFRLNNEESVFRLRRFLMLSCDIEVFITGDSEFHKHYDPEKVNFIDYVRPDVVSKIIKEFSGYKLPTRNTLFFALAYIITKAQYIGAERHLIYQTAISIMENDADFFCFVKFISNLKKGFSTGINKLISRYYNRKSPKDLAREFCYQLSYHKWTHRDLIKLSHIKCSDLERKFVVTAALKGCAEARQQIQNDDDANGTAEDLQRTIAKMERCAEFRRSLDEEFVIQFLIENPEFGFRQVPTTFVRSEQVWMTLVDRTDYRDLLFLLPRLYKYQLLAAELPLLKKIADIISCRELVAANELHPIELYIALKNFEKGGRQKDPKLIKHLEDKEECEKKKAVDPHYKKPDFGRMEPVRCPDMFDALKKAFEYSFNNLPISIMRKKSVTSRDIKSVGGVECLATRVQELSVSSETTETDIRGKSYLITISTLPQMGTTSCLTNKNVSCLEAAIVIALSYVRTEKNVLVAVFNGAYITPVTMNPDASVSANMTIILTAKSEGDLYGAPIDWAREVAKKGDIDVFINLHHKVNSWHYTLTKNNPCVSMRLYKYAYKKDAALIMWSLGGIGTTKEFQKQALLICGLDHNVPAVINAYLQNIVHVSEGVTSYHTRDIPPIEYEEISATSI